MKLFFSVLLVATAVMLSGCITTKHHDLAAPQISGTVTRAGVPVAGVHVQLADVLSDTGAPVSDAVKDEAVTDEQGHFTVGPLYRTTKRKTSIPVVNINLHTVPWGLRLSTDNKIWHAGWLSDPTMLGDVPKAPISAMCDLSVDSKSSVVAGDLALMGNGPCLLQLIVKNKKK